MSDLRRLYGPNLRAERARRGWRQSDLAERVGMPRATLADVEAGRRKLAVGEAAAVCAALGVSLDALLAGADEEAVWARAALAGEVGPPPPEEPGGPGSPAPSSDRPEE